ncbi:MAG: sigma 54-interacting transcriptional regulator [Nannocystaceae bacterium]
MSATRKLTSRWDRLGQITLRVCNGPQAGKEVVLMGDSARPIHVGRTPVNDLVLDDEHVSGTHLALTLHPQKGVHLRDLGSTNGVQVGKTRLTEAWLEPGAVFRIGSSVIQLVSTDSIEVPLSQEDSFGGLHGASPAMRERYALLEKLAKTPLAVLVLGETGTGKELAARGLHERSSRSQGPFIPVNCSALAAQLAESTLFGHARGSFTGAVGDQIGMFEAAKAGTLFLDEIGDLPLELQPKLLRALESREITRIGEHQPRRVNVRVIAATHHPLVEMVDRGTFRADLYHRLLQGRVVLPPLRDRVEDIVPLAERFLTRLAETAGERRSLSASARDILESEHWPGNVRELKNAIELAYYLADSPIISAADLRFLNRGTTSTRGEAIAFAGPLDDYLAERTREYVRHQLSLGGTRKVIADRIGRSVEWLRQNLRDLGVERGAAGL